MKKFTSIKKFTSMQQLIKELNPESINILFHNYIEYYINNGFLLKEIQNKALIAKSAYLKNIHCNENEYGIMNKFLQEFDHYEYAIPNNEFISYIINSTKLKLFFNKTAENIFINHNKNIIQSLKNPL